MADEISAPAPAGRPDDMADALRDAAANYAIPVCWVRAQGGKPSIVANGTAFLLDCGAGPFLVTAAHVYDGHVRARDEHADAVCVLGEIVRFDLDGRLIASDGDWDVATFRVDDGDVRALERYGKCALTGSQAAWPPAAPAAGQTVFCLGFPGVDRELRPYRGRSLVEVDWTGRAMVTVVEDVSRTSVSLSLDSQQFPTAWRQPEPLEGRRLWGCSGAPLLAYVERSGVSSWQLAGVVREALDLGTGLAAVRAARADCLNPDGTLAPHPFPRAAA